MSDYLFRQLLAQQFGVGNLLALRLDALPGWLQLHLGFEGREAYPRGSFGQLVQPFNEIIGLVAARTAKNTSRP